jgi:hypothetical protein
MPTPLADRSFQRVRCTLCDRLCLPEHAPLYSLDGTMPGAPVAERITARLCRIPTVRLADGGYGFTGCGVSEAVREYAPLLLTDPYLGVKAPAPLKL